ncbi:pentapeptide repeat-containing protein [Amycolatopsis azurea]|uniref:pentapeptide repeat-containing protein n=1 Tax=Amycolatopsis azurea TaxID=36819 RepID=UPI003826CF37
MSGDGKSGVEVLSRRTIVVVGAIVLVAGLAIGVTLVLAYGGPDRHLEAIKTAGTLVLGGGGAVALYLAARRQRSQEIALRQKETDQRLAVAVAEDSRADALERRLTEQYTRAADQLGNDKAPVRLAGLYALERLAQDNPGQRQMVVNVVCAYLRMPFAAPRNDDQAEELQVRKTAQQVLLGHLNHADDARFWPGTDIDLSGAMLVDFELSRCLVRTARFTGTRFVGEAWFTESFFSGFTTFKDARFTGLASFDDASFEGDAWFVNARFTGDAQFSRVKFEEIAYFTGASFRGGAVFMDTEFLGELWFEDVLYHQDTSVRLGLDEVSGKARLVAVELGEGEKPPLGNRAHWRRLVGDSAE